MDEVIANLDDRASASRDRYDQGQVPLPDGVSEQFAGIFRVNDGTLKFPARGFERRAQPFGLGISRCSRHSRVNLEYHRAFLRIGHDQRDTRSRFDVVLLGGQFLGQLHDVDIDAAC